jgi:hypothetical protein
MLGLFCLLAEVKACEVHLPDEAVCLRLIGEAYKESTRKCKGPIEIVSSEEYVS